VTTIHSPTRILFEPESDIYVVETIISIPLGRLCALLHEQFIVCQQLFRIARVLTWAPGPAHEAHDHHNVNKEEPSHATSTRAYEVGGRCWRQGFKIGNDYYTIRSYVQSCKVSDLLDYDQTIYYI
jgi:hypothetical protein